jgi:PKD repeat protein
MGVHAAGTQHGLAYKLAPLQGTRAPLIVALESRAPAAHVPFQVLQQLIWQIDGGLSYSEMPPQSQQLIDQLVPEFRNELREDFLKALQSKSRNIGRFLGNIGLGGAANIETGTVNALVQEYQRIHRALVQDANNYHALAHNFVHVLPGTVPNPGPTSWSRLNSKVYARLVGGNFYGEIGTLEVRVLPSAGSEASALNQGAPIRSARYAVTEGDPVDVPLQGLIAYPNSFTMQGLAGIPESGPTVQIKSTVNRMVVSVNGTATPTTSGATITQVEWNWGDGSPSQIGWFPEAHTYSTAGNYTISVTATDSNGLPGSASTMAEVGVFGFDCSNGFSLNMEYGGRLYQQCVEGDQSAFTKLAAEYRGGTWPALAAEAVYLQGVVNGSQKLTNIQIFAQNAQVTNPGTRYQIIYSTLLWGWEYGRLGIDSAFVEPYHSLENEIQKYTQSNSWRELAVGATSWDAWLNPIYWINQGVNTVFAVVGASTKSTSEKQLTEYLSLLNTLSQGYQASADSQVGAAGTQAAIKDFAKAGICLPPNYTASQFERALARAGTKSVNWDQLAAGLFRDSLGRAPSGALMTIKGVGLGASCLLNLAGDSRTLTVEEAASVETQCLAKNASERLAKFLLRQTLTQEILDAGMVDLAAQQGTDRAIETAAQQAAAKDAIEFYVNKSLDRVFFVLCVADTLDESYNLPMANMVQHSIDAGNAALQDFPTFFQEISGLSNGSTANIGIAPTTTDNDGLLNGTLAVLYLANAQYCSGTLPAVGCQNQVSSYQANAQAYADRAADILRAQSAAALKTIMLPNTSAPACAGYAPNGEAISSPTANSNSPSQTIAPGGISVNPSAQQSPASGIQPDQAIVSYIDAKLQQDSLLKTLDIQVSAQSGVVTLTGTVNTELEKAAVERIAKSEKGVVQVVDQLTVSNSLE